MVLDSAYYSLTGYASLLDQVRTTLLRTWTTSPRISRNGQAVTITFTDFKVDVVPAFYRQGGGFLIPSTSEQRWIETNPTTHVKFLSNANAQHASNLVPLVKMIKAWNREQNNTFVSFYLELLVEKALRGVTISDFSSGCRYVFDKGREIIKYKIIDPAGLGGQVNGISTGTVEQAISRFETAYSRAVRAETYAKNGQIYDAVNEWRKIFGNYFPAYG